jgi:hypothetical protein
MRHSGVVMGRKLWASNFLISQMKYLRERMGWYGLGRNCCEHGNEPSDSIKCWEVLE